MKPFEFDGGASDEQAEYAVAFNRRSEAEKGRIWQHLRDRCASAEAEVERLTAESEDWEKQAEATRHQRNDARAEVARLTKFEREHHELERRWEEDARPAFHALGKSEAEVARLTATLEGVRALADDTGPYVAVRDLRAVLDAEGPTC